MSYLHYMIFELPDEAHKIATLFKNSIYYNYYTELIESFEEETNFDGIHDECGKLIYQSKTYSFPTICKTTGKWGRYNKRNFII